MSNDLTTEEPFERPAEVHTEKRIANLDEILKSADTTYDLETRYGTLKVKHIGALAFNDLYAKYPIPLNKIKPREQNTLKKAYNKSHGLSTEEWLASLSEAEQKLIEKYGSTEFDPHTLDRLAYALSLILVEPKWTEEQCKEVLYAIDSQVGLNNLINEIHKYTMPRDEDIKNL